MMHYGRSLTERPTDTATIVPDNATIKRGRAYGSDTNSVLNMTFSIRKALYCSESFTAIATWTSTDNVANPTCIQATWASGALAEAVSNTANTYYFYFEIPYSLNEDNLRLWNVEIEYEVP